MGTTFHAVRFHTIAIALASLLTSVSPAAEPEIYFVPNVVDQFNALALRPEALGFALHDSPNPSLCRHYQAIARKPGPGMPYFFITRSGNDPGDLPCPISDVEGPGNLLVVRMGSRDITGERLRSNRLVRDSDISYFDQAFGNGFATPPDPRDAVVTWFSFDGQNGWPSYKHPEGGQVVGDVLPVGLEERRNSSDPESLVVFVDVSNPVAPVPLSRFAPTFDSRRCGVIALTPVVGANGIGRRYLLLVTGGDNSRVSLYRSLPTDPAGTTTDLKAPNLTWEALRSWTESEIESCLVPDCPLPPPLLCVDWPAGLQDPHQSLNFVRQDTLNGPLFLIGANNTLRRDEDRLHLYRVNVDAYGNPEDCLLTHIASKHVTSKPIMGGGDSANFAAASGVYVSPSGELIVYGAEYENDGPFSVAGDGTPIIDGDKRTVRFGEWRHREMVRPNSPTLKPGIEVGAFFEVDEGSVITLSAQAQRPITKAWFQFFEDIDLGLSLPGFLGGDAWLVVDYEDWGKDNFDNFSKLHFDNQADSMRWFAPVGCTLRLNQNASSETPFPGPFSKTLRGRGEVEEEPVLDNVPSDNPDQSVTIGDTISSMQFFADCDAYYGAPITVAWDLNLDSIFETSGENAAFSAAGLDGPAVRNILVRGQHPTDPTPLGQSAPKPVRIEVRNVPPAIASFAFVDSVGFKVGVDVPFALVNLEYRAEGTFTDPGKPDHQTAALSWGDGTVEANSAFDVFTDAFGGATGILQRRHIFGLPDTYPIDLHVLDDDGGGSESTLSINVVSPGDALKMVLQEIDLLLATATRRGVIAALRDARSSLDGKNGGKAGNGAIDKLDPVSMLVKLAAVVSALTRAEAAGGGNLNNLKYLITVIAESVAQTKYLAALAALPVPGAGQAQQLQWMRQAILDGRTLLAAGNYLGAIAKYKDAVGRAPSF